MNPCIDIERLLEPLTPAAPCGENLEYAPEFAAMLAAATGKPEQQVGETFVAAVPPQWAEVAERCEALLAGTRDLRVAARMTQALLHVHGLCGFAAGLALVRGYLERYWPELHPCLDPDDGLDPAIRLTAVALLCSLAAVVHPLRDATPLLQGAGGGAISLRHVLQARGGEAGDDGLAPTAAEIDDAVADAAPSALHALADAAQAARADLGAIEETLAAHAGAAFTLDFEPLNKVLAEIDALATHWRARRSEPAPAAAAEAPDDPWAEPLAPPPTAADRPSAGPIARREDALRVLDDLCRWFRRHEPSHPVPILLERARRWIEMDFMDLLRDLAPEAVVEAEKLRGATRAH
jgi:type VI secretion system protein ImpA